MTQTQFDSKLWGVTQKDLEGVTTLNGKPLTVDELRHGAHLESSSDGQYRVLLGRSTDYGTQQPIYTVKDGKVFNLDLRNRPDYVDPDGANTVPDMQPSSVNLMQTDPKGRAYPRGEFEERWWEPKKLEEGGIVDKLQAAGVVPGEVEMRGEPKGGPHGPREKVTHKLTEEEERTAIDFAIRGEHKGAISHMAKQLGIEDLKEPEAEELVQDTHKMMEEFRKKRDKMFKEMDKLKLPDLPQE